MDLWRKIRRSWTALSIRIKLRKSGGVAGGRGSGGGKYGGDSGGAGGGLLKLRDDVQMCGYKDVEVMWNMLSLGLQPEQMEAAPSTSAAVPNFPSVGASTCPFQGSSLGLTIAHDKLGLYSVADLPRV